MVETFAGGAFGGFYQFPEAGEIGAWENPADASDGPDPAGGGGRGHFEKFRGSVPGVADFFPFSCISEQICGDHSP